MTASNVFVKRGEMHSLTDRPAVAKPDPPPASPPLRASQIHATILLSKESFIPLH